MRLEVDGVLIPVGRVARLRVVEAQKELQHGRLARARGADQRHRLALTSEHQQRKLFPPAPLPTLCARNSAPAKPAHCPRIARQLELSTGRTLQAGEVKPVGGTDTVTVDVRVVAATNRDLRAELNACNDELRDLKREVEDLLFWGVMGVIVGGRLGYCLFYKPGYYAAHPLEVFAVWQGGMSFHGGMLGVMAAMVWFAYSRQRPFLQVMDFVAPCVPTGLAAGRVGNFINGELWGRVADPSLPWAMVFRGAGDLPRHPSQVYQFLMEGLLLFVLLWLYARRPRPLLPPPDV